MLSYILYETASIFNFCSLTEIYVEADCYEEESQEQTSEGCNVCFYLISNLSFVCVCVSVCVCIYVCVCVCIYVGECEVTQASRVQEAGAESGRQREKQRERGRQ